MKFLLRFCGNRALFILFATSLLVLFLDLLSIALIFPFLKLFISQEVILSTAKIKGIYDLIHFSSPQQFIVAIGIALIVAYFLKFVIKIAVTKLRFHTMNTITWKLSTDLFQGMLNAKYAIFTEGSASEMIGIVNAQTIHSMICLDSWVIIINEIAFLAVLIGIFLYINPLMTLGILAIFGLMGVILYFTLVKKINTYGQIHSRLNLLVYKFGFAVANSIKDIKIMGLESKYADRFSQIWQEYSENDSRSKNIKSIPKEFSETLIFCAIILICLIVLWTGQNIVDLIPALGVVAVSAMRMLPSFNRIISSYNEFKYYRKALDLVHDLFATFEANRQTVARLRLPFERTLSLRSVSLSYGDKTVLDDVSLSVDRGSSIAFVGPSGAGKSTLLDVLVGLRESDGGEFVLDNTTFDPFKTDAFRCRVGYVPQQVNLVDDSIAYNISFDENHDPVKMEQVIRMSRLEPYIRDLDQGLATVIGESGVRVSGGQRQRIGIARALYRDPEVLVFDEATSSLDTITERELMEEINALSGTKTLIIVAHRLSTVEKCDQIHLLENGRIVARGSHKELLSSCQQYQKLYYQQQT